MKAHQAATTESARRRGASSHVLHVGRVGALAVALGIGSLFASTAVAFADTTDSAASSGSGAGSGAASAGSSAPASAARGASRGPASRGSKTAITRPVPAAAGSVSGVKARPVASGVSDGTGNRSAAEPLALMAAATSGREGRGAPGRVGGEYHEWATGRRTENHCWASDFAADWVGDNRVCGRQFYVADGPDPGGDHRRAGLHLRLSAVGRATRPVAAGPVEHHEPQHQLRECGRGAVLEGDRRRSAPQRQRALFAGLTGPQ